MEDWKTVRRAAWRETLRPASGRGSAAVNQLAGPAGVIATQLDAALTPLSRIRGVIGRRLPQGSALLIAPCSQVHTFGLRDPIDAVFCDAELRVLFFQTLAPRRVSRHVRGARCCFELPAGTADANGVSAGTVLRIVPGAVAGR